MAIAIPEWTDALDVLIGDTEHGFGVIAPGGSPTLVTYRLYDNFSAAGPVDDGRNWQLIVEARIAGDAEWQTSGIAALTNGTFKVRQTAANSVVVSRNWVVLGTGITFPLVDLADGDYHEFEVQPQPPATGPELTVEWQLALALATAITVGNSAIVPQGIRRGIGRGEVTGVVARSGSIGATGIDQLDVPDYNHIHLGVPHSELAQAITLDANDSAPAALGAGEEYPFYLVMSAAGLAIVKGLLKTAPLVYPDDWPTVTGDDRRIAYGQRHFSNNLIAVELPAADPDFYHANVVGLDAIIGNTAGPVSVGTERQDTTTPTTVPLTDDATNWLWVMPDQTFAVTTDGSRPLPVALLLWEITMVASAETARVDHRRWVGSRRTLDFRFPGAAGGEIQSYINSSGSTFWIRPDMVSGWMDPLPPSWAVAPSAGQLALDLRVDGVSSHPSSGADDRRVLWAWDETVATAVGLPETAGLAWPPGSILSMQVVWGMTGGTFYGEAVASVVLDEG